MGTPSELQDILIKRMGVLVELEEMRKEVRRLDATVARLDRMVVASLKDGSVEIAQARSFESVMAPLNGWFESVMESAIVLNYALRTRAVADATITKLDGRMTVEQMRMRDPMRLTLMEQVIALRKALAANPRLRPVLEPQIDGTIRAIMALPKP